jgi:hypothetical protein
MNNSSITGYRNGPASFSKMQVYGRWVYDYLSAIWEGIAQLNKSYMRHAMSLRLEKIERTI